MAEGDKGVHEGTLPAAEGPLGDEVAVGVGIRGEDLGVAELVPQQAEELAAAGEDLAVAAAHVEGPEEDRVHAVGDGEAVGAVHAEV